MENTAAQKFRSNEDFEMMMGYFNYLMEEETNAARLFPSDLDKNEDRIFQFSEIILDILVQWLCYKIIIFLFTGELKKLFSLEDLENHAHRCQIPTLRQEFTVSDIETCSYLNHVLSGQLLPYSHYHFGATKCGKVGATMQLTCDSLNVKEKLEWISKYDVNKTFASIQDIAGSNCDTTASEVVLDKFLLSIFPSKSKFEI